MKPHVKYGLIAGVASIIWTLIMYLTGVDKSDMANIVNWVAMAVILIFVVLAVKEQRDMNKGYITFGNAFKTSFLTFLISGVIGCAYYYIHTAMIDPSLIEYMRDKAMDEMANKNIPEDQIDIAMKYTNMFLSPGALTAMGFLFNLIIGAIAGLIVAAIMKKDPPPGEMMIQ